MKGYKFILAFFLLGKLAFVEAALPTQNDLQVLKNDYQGHQSNLQELRKGLSGLENDLGKKSASYIQALRRQRDLESMLNQVDEQVQSSEERLKKNYGLLKRSLRQALLGQLTEEDSGTEIVANRYVLNSLKSLVQDFDKEIKLNQNLQLELATLRQRLTEYQVVESEIQDIIREMEMKKKNLADDYWKEMSTVDQIKKQMEEQRNRQRQEILDKEKNEQLARQKNKIPDSTETFAKSLPLQGLQLGLLSPSTECGHPTFKEKSLEMNCPTGIQLRAAASGKVVFSGELSTFGRVILIDHGNDLKTVLLGEIKENVQKGQEVNKGDIIGMTHGQGNAPAPIVFELRKRNIALKSKQWASLVRYVL